MREGCPRWPGLGAPTWGSRGHFIFCCYFWRFQTIFFSILFFFFSIPTFNSLCFAIKQYCYRLTRRDQILDSGPVLDQFWISRSLYIFVVLFAINFTLLFWGLICIRKYNPTEPLFTLWKEILEEKLIQLRRELVGSRHPVSGYEGTITLLSFCHWR